MASFERKVIAITGGASGIGLATATLLASRGAIVSLADLNQAGLDGALKAIEAPETPLNGHKDHLTTVVDVRNSAQVDAWIARTLEKYGSIDGAVNLAGIVKPNALIDETDEDWKLTMDVNATGVFHCLRAEIKAMKEGSSIVSASSFVGIRAGVYCAAYSASKFAVSGMTRLAAREAPHIRINAVAPGPVKTPMTAGMEEVLGNSLPVQGAAIKRYAQPREIATVIAFLLSDEASYITGVVLPVDGGLAA